MLRPKRDALTKLLGALLVAASFSVQLLQAGPVTALTCGITATMPANSAELAIAGGWPDDPYDAVVIGAITGIRSVQGDAGTFGETLTVDLEAVLIGPKTRGAVEIFNPPLGSAGWIGFEVGTRYLIAAYADEEHGLSTFLCTPNQRVDTRERFEQLISVAEHPFVPDTATNTAAPDVLGLPAAILGGLLLVTSLITLLRAPLPASQRGRREDPSADHG